MADEAKTLAWRLIVETTNIDKNTRQAANSLANMETATQKLTKGLKGLGVVASAAAVGKLALEAIKTADAYVAMANTLRQSTESAAELQAVQEALIEQAHATSSTVELATSSFNKLHDATEGLGLSQQQVIDLSKTLADTMRLSGMNAEQAQQGINAFANSLEDGGMNLKEFKQAFKESPELIKALQVGLGKTKDELRLMAEQGELTSQMLVEGLGRAAPDVAAKVGQLAPTISDALKSMASSFGAMIGEFSEGSGATENMARAIMGVGETFKEIAQKAHLFGIAMKVAVGTVTIEVLTFIDQTIENLKRLGIEFAQAADWFLTGGQAFGEELAEQERKSDERLRNILNNRKTGLEALNAEADAAVDKLFGANLNKPSEVAAKVLTDEQVKVLQNFDRTLDGLKTRASDATNELEALRIEMQSGNQSADAFRAQLQAVAAGRDFRKQMEDQFKKEKVPFGPEQIAQIDKFVASLAKSTTQTKLTTDAWSTLQGAMNGAMNDTERAAKETEDLTRALAQLKTVMQPTEAQLVLIDRALAQIAERSKAAQTGFDEAMRDIGTSASHARTDLQALNIQMTRGADAARAFRRGVNAEEMTKNLEETWSKAFEKAGRPFGDEQRADIKLFVDSLLEAEDAIDSTSEAWAVYGQALDSSMTESERAQKSIDELNRAMILLDQKGLLTDDMIRRFDIAFQHIADAGDMVTQTWRNAARTVIDNFVDFLADGEFNMKRFVQSTIREVGRLIIQMMIMKSLAGTKFGTWLGIKAASGAAFNHGQLVPMASGGIVSAPTLFPMAGGRTGLMGEAGPEAVMPLARLSSGKLGVSAQPANIQVVNNTGVQASARIERSQNRTSIILEAAQLGAQMAEERMTRSMRSGYGATSNALQKTYALRRRG